MEARHGDIRRTCFSHWSALATASRIADGRQPTIAVPRASYRLCSQCNGGFAAVSSHGAWWHYYLHVAST